MNDALLRTTSDLIAMLRRERLLCVAAKFETLEAAWKAVFTLPESERWTNVITTWLPLWDSAMTEWRKEIVR